MAGTEIIVGVSIGAMKPLIGKLATLVGEEFAGLKNLRKDVEFISQELIGMNDALERLSDVNELDPQTNRWRNQIREMSYDIENIIDDFIRRIGERTGNDGSPMKIARFLKKLRARYQIAGQIKKIKARVIETNERRQRNNINIPASNSVEIDSRVTSFYENVDKLVGVEGPKNKLVDLLMDEEKQLKMVSIVGSGGLGKTTLANVVYGKLKDKFKSCAFVSISQRPNIPRLLRSLLLGLGFIPFPYDCELTVLLNQLREHLQNKRYLIVIDDIWTVQAWNIIKCAFPENYLGSRVVVTTRIHDVAMACCSYRSDCNLPMIPLSSEDSRRLFFSRTFGSEEACPPELKVVSDEILEKCDGLPLAVICISGMLTSEGSNQKERWEYVRKSLGSGTNATFKGMMQILELSYRDLPAHLRTCLLYVGMYPEDYIVERCNLERQWMAEGFITKENGQDVEKVARNYFGELVNRNLIQPIYSQKHGSVTGCRVHDMMLHFILLKSAQENFLTIVENPQDLEGLEYDVRRLSIRLDGQTILPGNIIKSQVRSVMFFGSSKNTPPLLEFKYLRVIHIDLDDGEIDLTGLCKLYQLRHLRISHTWSLPPQIRVLQHLETLDLTSCSSVPSDIVHLTRLTHLLNVSTRLPDGIGNLKSLQHLCAFIIEKNMLDNIKGLGELINLRFLSLKVDRESDNIDALFSSLGRLCNLEELTVNMWYCVDGLMQLSCPSTAYHLESLIMSWTCWFSRVPSWMRKLRNLRRLECEVDQLLNGGVCILADLPALADLRLKVRRYSIIEMITIYGGGAFPCLRHFELKLRSVWYLSFQVGAMPKLQMLKLWFNVHESEQIHAAPAGIEHLLALEELSAVIGCCKETGRTSAESALRNAITMHPGQPRIGIETSPGSIYFSDE